MALEFAQRIRRIPVYPVASGLRPRRRHRDARLERVVLRAAARGRRGGRRACSPAPTAIRTRRTCRCAARCPTATAIPARGSRSATARATSCWPPARRCSSRGRRSSTRGRRSASTRTWRRRPGARAIEVPLDSEDRHDLDAMLAEITVATRLVLICNPNNPTSTALSLERIEAFLERVPRHVCVILDEAYCEFCAEHRRPVRIGRAAAPLPQPRAAADLLEGLRPGRAARRLRAVRAPRTSAPRSTRSASRST